MAKRFGRKNRQKIQEFGESIFGKRLSSDNKSVTNFSLEGYAGQALFTGLGGSITGQGAHLLLLDDIIKNRKEALSEVYREWAWDEYQSSLNTRLAPNGAIVLIMTRWHEDDLAGRLLKEEGNQWDVLKLPAIAEEHDLLDRKIGEPLWPEYGFDKAWAIAKKKEVGAMTWASLYQQRPSPAEGNIFKRRWFQFYKKLPETFDEVLLSVDATFKDKKESDYCVLQVWGREGANKYLIDQVREQMSFTQTVQSLRSICAKYPSIGRKLIEDKANGSAIIDFLKNEIEGLIGVNPDGSKTARAYSVQPTVEAGNVFVPFPHRVEWVDEFINECATFPNGTHDDQVDGMTQALHHFNKPFDIFIGRA